MATCFLLLLVTIQYVRGNNVSSNGENDGGFNWGYDADNGPSTWPGICQTGLQQSPINISQSMTISYNCDELNFLNYSSSGSIQLYNSGRSLAIIGFASWEAQPSIGGGGLNGSYDLAQCHFHWSQTDQSSADHVIGSVNYPLKLHLVHIKHGLDITEAAQLPDGLAVIEVLFEINEGVASPLLSMQNAINATRPENGYAWMDGFEPDSLLPTVRSSFYRYAGSLTTYPCTEAVVWTLLAQPLPVTHTLVDMFRQFEDSSDNLLLSTSRPTQPLNNRPVLLRQLTNNARSIIVEKRIIPIYLMLLGLWSSG